MRGPAWGVPVLIVAGCSAGYSRVEPATGDAHRVAATWEVERSSPASRDVEVAFVLAECTAVQRVDVVESAARVVITLDIGGREGRDCTAPVRKHRSVRLAAPLGDRPLYDGSVSPPERVA